MTEPEPQPRTAAQRQAAHRARAEHAFRLQVWLPEDAGNALRRLAAHHGAGQADLIARLLMAADAEAVAGVPDDQLDAYYGIEREAPPGGRDPTGQSPGVRRGPLTVFSGCRTPEDESARVWRGHIAADAISRGDWGHLSAVDGGLDEAAGRDEPEYLAATSDGRPDWRDRIVPPGDS